MKAIDTVYKGCAFRSRLEARWAVLFDALGIEWRYEAERYGNERHTYLPDFYLPFTKTWVEVKGDSSALRQDWERMASLLDFGGVLPDFADSGYMTPRGLLLLGEIPDVSDFWGLMFHPVIQHRKGLVRNWLLFHPKYVVLADFEKLAPQFEFEPGAELEEAIELESGPTAGWEVESKRQASSKAFPAVLDAYRVARAARFEHGSNGPSNLTTRSAPARKRV